MRKKIVRQSVAAIAALVCVGQAVISRPAVAEDKLKIGFVFFLSAPGAAYGSHARDGAKLIVEALNAGKVPAPYDKPGINGVQIEPVFVDEAGGAQKQLAEYRRIDPGCDRPDHRPGPHSYGHNVRKRT